MIGIWDLLNGLGGWMAGAGAGLWTGVRVIEWVEGFGKGLGFEDLIRVFVL